MKTSSILLRDEGVWNNPHQKKSRTEKLVRQIEHRKTCYHILQYLALIFLYALVLVFLSTQSSVLGYQILGLEIEIRAAETEQHNIESKIATLSSPPIIESLAKSQLGMHAAEDADMMRIYENGKLVSGTYNYAGYK